MGWNEDGLGLWRICPICGKKFLPEVRHVYRDKSDPNRKLVCTYSCMRESERRVEERRRKNPRNYRRLNPEEMTARQKRLRNNRTRVKCSECEHTLWKEDNGVTRVYCGNPGNENARSLLAVFESGEQGNKIKTPKWCPLERGEDGDI